MLVTGHDGRSRVWQGVMEDITTRVEAEQAVRVSAAQYATLLENLPAVVYEMVPDDDRRTRYVNRKIEDLLGYTMDEGSIKRTSGPRFSTPTTARSSWRPTTFTRRRATLGVASTG